MKTEKKLTGLLIDLDTYKDLKLISYKTKKSMQDIVVQLLENDKIEIEPRPRNEIKDLKIKTKTLVFNISHELDEKLFSIALEYNTSKSEILRQKIINTDFSTYKFK